MSTLFYVISPLCQIGANFLLHQFSTAVKSPVQKELMDKKGIWRPLMDPLMLYPFIGAPVVNAIMLHQICQAFQISTTGTVLGSCRIALWLWVFGPLHGMLINYTSVKVSAIVSVHFALTTLVSALINGAVYGYFQSKSM
jgi:hypothetical protein